MNNTEVKINKKSRKKIALTVISALSAFAIMLLFLPTLTVHADEMTDSITSLGSIIFGVIRVVGIILAAFGLIQVFMSMNSHDTNQRTQGFWLLGTGVAMAFLENILGAIGLSF